MEKQYACLTGMPLGRVLIIAFPANWLLSGLSVINKFDLIEFLLHFPTVSTLSAMHCSAKRVIQMYRAESEMILSYVSYFVSFVQDCK